MLDREKLEKKALEQLLEFNAKSKNKMTFQEKFNRFNEINLKNWEEEGNSEVSFGFQKEKNKDQTNILKNGLPLLKDNVLKLEQIKHHKYMKNPIKIIQTESDFPIEKTKIQERNMKLIGKKVKRSSFNQKSLISLENHRSHPSSENNINQTSSMKSINKYKKPLDLKMISATNKSAQNILFLNDFNENMVKNRHNFSPSNFTILNLENNLIGRNQFENNFKHNKMKSVGANSLSNFFGILKENQEKEKTYKVLHSLKYFNLN